MGNYKNMNEPKYLEQYRTMKRWYRRFEDIDKGRSHNAASDNYQDEVYAFFISCYHLKDWIANDAKSGISKILVEKFVQNDKYLKICGDICNGIKHLNLNNPKMGSGAKIGGRNFSLILGEEESVINVKYNIDVDGKTYDAFLVATEAVKLWENFLCDNNKNFKLIL